MAPNLIRWSPSRLCSSRREASHPGNDKRGTRLVMALPSCWISGFSNIVLLLIFLIAFLKWELRKHLHSSHWKNDDYITSLSIIGRLFISEQTQWYCCKFLVWVITAQRRWWHITERGWEFFTFMQWPLWGQLLSVTCKEQNTIASWLF